MSENGKGSSLSIRRLVVRLALVVVYVGLLVLVFWTGKGHTLLLDNKDAEDGSCKALEGISVSLNGGEPVAFEFGLDRDMAKVRGQRHRLVIEGLPGNKKLEKEITVPLWNEMLLVSLPKLVAGLEPAVIPFVPKEVPVPPSDGSGGPPADTASESTGMPPEAPPAQPAQ